MDVKEYSDYLNTFEAPNKSPITGKFILSWEDKVEEALTKARLLVNSNPSNIAYLSHYMVSKHLEKLENLDGQFSLLENVYTSLSLPEKPDWDAVKEFFDWYQKAVRNREYVSDYENFVNKINSVTVPKPCMGDAVRYRLIIKFARSILNNVSNIQNALQQGKFRFEPFLPEIFKFLDPRYWEVDKQCHYSQKLSEWLQRVQVFWNWNKPAHVTDDSDLRVYNDSLLAQINSFDWNGFENLLNELEYDCRSIEAIFEKIFRTPALPSEFEAVFNDLKSQILNELSELRNMLQSFLSSFSFPSPIWDAEFEDTMKQLEALEADKVFKEIEKGNFQKALSTPASGAVSVAEGEDEKKELLQEQLKMQFDKILKKTLEVQTKEYTFKKDSGYDAYLVFVNEYKQWVAKALEQEREYEV